MNFTTMNMFAPRILGYSSKDAQMRTALAQGWVRSDLAWERLLERANIAWQNGKQTRATFLIRGADILARLKFPENDLRKATTSANLSIALYHRGKAQKAKILQQHALDIWHHTEPAVQSMKILPRSRSSLFHLRMEALHRKTYHDNTRLRMTRFTQETQMTLNNLTCQTPPTKHRHFKRWRGEKPTVFDDTRKILGACLLIFDVEL